MTKTANLHFLFVTQGSFKDSISGIVLNSIKHLNLDTSLRDSTLQHLTICQKRGF